MGWIFPRLRALFFFPLLLASLVCIGSPSASALVNPSPETRLACDAVARLGGQCTSSSVSLPHSTSDEVEALAPLFSDADMRFVSSLDLSNSRVTRFPSAELLRSFNASFIRLRLNNVSLEDISSAQDWDHGLVHTLELRDSGLTSAILELGGSLQGIGLAKLDLYGADLSEGIPSGFLLGNPNLTDLALVNCKLQELPPQLLARAPKLIRISLVGNKLVSFEADAFALNNRALILELQNNLLETLPPTLFQNLSSLGQLELAGNRLSSLPDELFSGNRFLFGLNLKGNLLEGLPAGLFSNLTALTSMNLGSNLLSYPLAPNASDDAELFAPLASVVFRTLDLSFNTALDRLGSQLAELTDLRSLDLRGCGFERLDPELSVLPPRLIELFLSNMRIREVAPGFFTPTNLQRMRTLNLADNELRGMPGNFTFCSSDSLQTLDLSLNRLGEAPGGFPAGIFEGCTNLVMLDLSNNRIRSMSRGSLAVAFQSRINTLSLSSNEFSGSLDADWFLGSEQDVRPPWYLRNTTHALGSLMLMGMPLTNLTDLQRLCWSLPRERSNGLAVDMTVGRQGLLFPLPDCVIDFSPVLMGHLDLTRAPSCNCHGRASGCTVERCNCLPYAFGDWCQSVDKEVSLRFNIRRSASDWLAGVGHEEAANAQFAAAFFQEVVEELDFSGSADRLLEMRLLRRVASEDGSDPALRAVQLDFVFRARPDREDLRTSDDFAGELRAMIEDAGSSLRQRPIGSLVNSGFWRSFDILGATFDFLAGLEIWQLVLLLLGLLVITLSAYLYVQRLNPRANNAIIPVILFNLADIASDFVFMVSLSEVESLRKEFLWSLVFLVTPMAISAGIIAWVMHTERRSNGRWVEFVRRHSASYALACLLGLSSTANLRLLSSRVLHAPMFSGPLSEHADYLLQLGGFASVLLEDLPQLAIQIIVIRKQRSWSSLATVALCFTGIALFFGFAKRVWVGVFGVDDLDNSKTWGDEPDEAQVATAIEHHRRQSSLHAPSTSATGSGGHSRRKTTALELSSPRATKTSALDPLPRVAADDPQP